METATQVPFLSSLQQVWDIADQQVTAQELLNERLYIKRLGWSTIALSFSFRMELARNIAERLGGHQSTKNAVEYVLTHKKPQHWGLGRFILQQVGTRLYIGYVAGQDQTWESNVIRTYLKNL